MLASIRSALFLKSLRQALAMQKRLRKPHNLESARTIALLFDATDPKIRQEVVDISHSLEKTGKKVRLLGFYNSKEIPTDLPFEFFNKKETTWTGRPKSPKAEAFMEAKTDLMICFNPESIPAIDWISVKSLAAMKIGMPTDHLNDYDLQLEIPKGKNNRYFMEQLKFYLDKIVLTEHATSKAS
jgi:hypothetical protein